MPFPPEKQQIRLVSPCPERHAKCAHFLRFFQFFGAFFLVFRCFFVVFSSFFCRFFALKPHFPPLFQGVASRQQQFNSRDYMSSA